MRSYLHKNIIIIVLILSIIILAFSVFFSFKKALKSSNVRFINHGKVLKYSATNFKTTDVYLIEPWMTFDYINHIFGLPKDYLSSNLQISNKHYPNLSINKYAREKKTTGYSEVTEIRNVILLYFSKSK